MTDLVERLRATAPESGWAVVNTKTDGIVIWFSDRREFSTERKAREWLQEHAGTHRNHEVRPYKDACLDHDAADDIERLRGERVVFASWIRQALLCLETIDPDEQEDGGEHHRMFMDSGERLVKPNV